MSVSKKLNNNKAVREAFVRLDQLPWLRHELFICSDSQTAKYDESRDQVDINMLDAHLFVCTADRGVVELELRGIMSPKHTLETYWRVTYDGLWDDVSTLDEALALLCDCIAPLSYHIAEKASG